VAPGAVDEFSAIEEISDRKKIILDPPAFWAEGGTALAHRSRRSGASSEGNVGPGADSGMTSKHTT